MKKLTKAQQRAVWLNVARHIEKKPDLYSFNSWAGKRDERACVLARAGTFIKGCGTGKLDLTAKKLGFVEACAAYEALDAILAPMMGKPFPNPGSWLLALANPAQVALACRLMTVPK